MPGRGLGKDYQGSKWIRPEKRTAIYLRDGLACAWCGATLEEAPLSLDHLLPHSAGGGHEASNLVTACKRCNSSRADRSTEEFAKKVAGYLNAGQTAEAILGHIAACVARPLDMKKAKEVLAARTRKGIQ